jgi:hypothetical protein
MASPDINQASVAAAISLYLGVDSGRPEIVAIASRINLQGLKVSPGDNLSQNGDFRSRLLAVGGADLERLVGSDKAEQLRRDQDGQMNAVAHGRFAALAGGLGVPLWLQTEGSSKREASSGSPPSGAKYGETYWGSPEGQARMQAYARDSGLGWAAGHSDLLRLGPAAIDTLKDVHFRQQTFERMRHEGGFTAKDIVGLADYAKRHGLPASKLGEVSTDTVKTLGDGNQHEEKKWRELIAEVGRYKDKPAEEEVARHKLIDELRHHRKQRPEHGTQIDRQLDVMKLQAEAHARENAEVAKADKQEAIADKREAKVDQKNASLASLLDDDASSTSNAQTSGQPSQQKVEVKTAAAPEKPASEPAPTQLKQAPAAPKSSAAPKPA